MTNNNTKGTKLAKAALARITNITSGTTGVTDQRVSPMAQSLGITFDNNNNVSSNSTNDDISLLNAKIDALAALFGVTFDSLGAVLGEQYTSHTHDYQDDNGTTVLSGTTSGVN